MGIKNFGAGAKPAPLFLYPLFLFEKREGGEGAGYHKKQDDPEIARDADNRKPCCVHAEKSGQKHSGEGDKSHYCQRFHNLIGFAGKQRIIGVS